MSESHPEMSLTQQSLFVSIAVFMPSCMLPLFQLYSSMVILMRLISLVFFFISLISIKKRDVQIGIALFLMLSLVFSLLLWKAEWSNVYDMGTKVPLLLLFALPVAQTLLFCAAPSKRLAQWTITEYFLIAIGTAVCTIAGNSQYDIPSRYLATSQLDNTIRRMYYGMNIGGYDYVYSLIFVVPIVLMIGRNGSKAFRIFTIACAVLFAVCVAFAQFMYALLLLFTAILLFLFENMRPGRGKTVLFVGIPVLAIIAMFMAPTLFSALAEHVTSVSNMLGARLNEIALSLSGQGLGKDASMRAEDYTDSINAFLGNPLFGSLFSDNVEIGRHSELLDLLGGLGLFGVALLIAICACVKLTLNSSVFNSPWTPSMFITLVLFAMINTVTVGQSIAVSCFLLTALSRYCALSGDSVVAKSPKLESLDLLAATR